jgi:hypothetical protein
MTSNEMLLRLRKTIKTPEPEIMALPYGNGKPQEVIDWILSLSDEEFSLLMQTPIIIYAKMFYSKIRKERKR